MQRILPWMNRDDPAYDPNRIGAITEAKVMTALVEAGKMVWTPCFNVRPYDLVFEEEGKFYRVQCKTGRIFRGAVCFQTHRLRAAKRETGWQRRKTNYSGEIDFFGVYCPENSKVYLVPITDTPNLYCNLRLTPAKNNQAMKIRWAKDYEVVPQPLETDPTIDLFTDG